LARINGGGALAKSLRALGVAIPYYENITLRP
jgi:hypothetical protein